MKTLTNQRDNPLSSESFNISMSIIKMIIYDLVFFVHDDERLPLTNYRLSVCTRSKNKLNSITRVTRTSSQYRLAIRLIIIPRVARELHSDTRSVSKTYTATYSIRVMIFHVMPCRLIIE